MIRKIIKGGDFKPLMIGEIVFDQEPEAGSFNPITSDAAAKIAGGVADIDEKIPSDASSINKLATENDVLAVMKAMEEDKFRNEPISPNTLRFSFEKMDYDPRVLELSSYSHPVWVKRESAYLNVWECTASAFMVLFSGKFRKDAGSETNFDQTGWVKILAGNITGNGFMKGISSCESVVDVEIREGDFDNSSGLYYSFDGCVNLKRLVLPTSGIKAENMDSMCYNCKSLKSVNLFDTSSITDAPYAFYGCENLEAVPRFDTSSVTNFHSAFYECKSLKYVPKFDTSSMTVVTYAFSDCKNVEGGARALYQQMSTQTTPPSSHYDTFKNCGVDTTTGMAELEQIPTSWGGLEEPNVIPTVVNSVVGS